MAPPENRRLKLITLTIGGIAVECQVTEWKLTPPDNVSGDKVYTFCPDGEFREETDREDYTLELKWVTDWTAAGFNRYLWANQGATAAFTLTNHPTTAGVAVRWAGDLIIAAPSAGGEARTTEMSELTFDVVGEPEMTYPTVV